MHDQTAEIFPDEEIWRQCVCLGRWVTSLRAGLCPCIFIKAFGMEVIGPQGNYYYYYYLND